MHQEEHKSFVVDYDGFALEHWELDHSNAWDYVFVVGKVIDVVVVMMIGQRG